METPADANALTPADLRVAGALIEKSLATPDYYPMSTNALMAACNQKTGRDPVMDLSERDVRQALDRLMRFRMAGTSDGGRVTKYRHAFGQRFGLDEPGLATVAVLILRGPQTTGEIRSRVGRMYDFASTDAVQEVLDRMSDRPEPLATLLPRQAGQSADRWAHLLAGEPDLSAYETPDGAVVSGEEAMLDAETRASLTERVDTLEAEVAELRTSLEALREALGG
ncbi:MAG: YceH family protein [Bacteroidota bacterium]